MNAATLAAPTTKHICRTCHKRNRRAELCGAAFDQCADCFGRAVQIDNAVGMAVHRATMTARRAALSRAVHDMTPTEADIQAYRAAVLEGVTTAAALLRASGIAIDVEATAARFVVVA